ncbi:hypothetical protein BaRGS_00020250 [Batillaria attramentaria]|uniref:Uncharacterized protein n=1 Tax=Batillaria attramentaria TaxID=370345 RepID=A0ABD0KN71_9CAEN
MPVPCPLRWPTRHFTRFFPYLSTFSLLAADTDYQLMEEPNAFLKQSSSRPYNGASLYCILSITEPANGRAYLLIYASAGIGKSEGRNERKNEETNGPARVLTGSDSQLPQPRPTL